MAEEPSAQVSCARQVWLEGPERAASAGKRGRHRREDAHPQGVAEPLLDAPRRRAHSVKNSLPRTPGVTWEGGGSSASTGWANECSHEPFLPHSTHSAFGSAMAAAKSSPAPPPALAAMQARELRVARRDPSRRARGEGPHWSRMASRRRSAPTTAAGAS